MSRPHLINRIWFRYNCRTVSRMYVCVASGARARIIAATRIASANKFIPTRSDISSRPLSCVDTSVRFVVRHRSIGTETSWWWYSTSQLPTRFIVGRYRKMNCKSLRMFRIICRSYFPLFFLLSFLFSHEASVVNAVDW